MFQEKESYKSGEKALTKVEYEKLMNVIGSLEHELLIKLAVSTGMRREDITNILIKNIDFNENKITFFEKKKNRISQVYLNNNVKLLIQKHLNTISKKQEKLFAFQGRTAYNILNRYCGLAGIPGRPFHALRATCIKFAQANGWSAEQTAKHVGDTIRTIQAHYTTPSSAEMSEVAKNKSII